MLLQELMYGDQLGIILSIFLHSSYLSLSFKMHEGFVISIVVVVATMCPKVV